MYIKLDQIYSYYTVAVPLTLSYTTFSSKRLCRQRTSMTSCDVIVYALTDDGFHRRRHHIVITFFDGIKVPDLAPTH